MPIYPAAPAQPRGCPLSMVSLSGMGPLLGDADSEQGIAMIL
jgi:hypothetical protein